MVIRSPWLRSRQPNRGRSVPTVRLRCRLAISNRRQQLAEAFVWRHSMFAPQLWCWVFCSFQRVRLDKQTLRLTKPSGGASRAPTARQDFETTTVATQRIQILLYRLQAQEAAVARASRRLDDADAELARIAADRARLVTDIKQHEDFVRQTENPPAERKKRCGCAASAQGKTRSIAKSRNKSRRRNKRTTGSNCDWSRPNWTIFRPIWNVWKSLSHRPTIRRPITRTRSSLNDLPRSNRCRLSPAILRYLLSR